MADDRSHDGSDVLGATTRVVVQIDVVGYSLLTASDDPKKITSINKELDHLRDYILSEGGEVHTRAGDCFLATFSGVNDALSVAFAIQGRDGDVSEFLALTYRIGIHVGEVYQIAGDVAGNAVNIAARLEALAPHGGICISHSAWAMSPRQLRQRFSEAGKKELKNIPDPVEIYRYDPVIARAEARPRAAAQSGTGLHVSSKKRGRTGSGHRDADERLSILIRPFRVLSGDSSDMFFAQGFAADLMMRLSRFRHLDVIGRNTSASVPAGIPDVNAGELADARYVATGHFQRSGSRMRLGVMLTDARNNRIVWSELYSKSLDDFFDVQSSVADEATAAMAVHIEKIEERLARARDPSDLNAYALVVRGRLENMEDGAVGRAATERAIRFFSAAAERDRGYSSAVAGLARAASVQWRFGWCDDRQEKMTLATDLAMGAIEIDDNDATSHAELGYVSLYNREHDRSIAAYERALQLNPSDVDIIAFYADALKHAGNPIGSIPHFKRAIRLNPLHPDIYLGNMAHAYFLMEDFESAISTIRRMRQQLTAQRVLTASLMLAGREEEGLQEASRLRRHLPNFSAAEWCRIVPDRLPEHSELLKEGLQKAGF